MLRSLLFASLLLLTGCGAASISPDGDKKTAPTPGAEKTDKTAALSGNSGGVDAVPTPSEPAPEVVPPATELKPDAEPVEAEPDTNPAVAKTRPRIIELEPPDVPPDTPPAKPAAKDTNSKELVLQAIRLKVPDTWISKKPEVGFLLAEYSLPRVAGDEADGRVTITTAGSGVKQVIAMWRGQFGGKPDKESQEDPQILGLWATLVDYSGTYRSQPSQSAPVELHPNYRMLGVICDTGDKNQMYFIKAIGPAKTIAAHADEFRAFIGSIKLR